MARLGRQAAALLVHVGADAARAWAALREFVAACL
jgi:hypothetical protein